VFSKEPPSETPQRKVGNDLNAAISIERRGKIRCLGEARPGARAQMKR